MAKTQITRDIETCLVELAHERSQQFALEAKTLKLTKYYPPSHNERKKKKPDLKPRYVWTARVDFCMFDAKGIFSFFEIKISKADFRSKHGHNFYGHRNFYAMPIELYEQVSDEIPRHIGVYVYDKGDFYCIKRGKLIKAFLESEEAISRMGNRPNYRMVSGIERQKFHMAEAACTRVWRLMCDEYQAG